MALQVHDARMHFSGLHVLRGVSFEVPSGQRRAIIGPNGAGKSTLFNVISGELRATNGRVSMFGHDITRSPMHERARRGLSRTYQHSNVFLESTAWENVRLAAQIAEGAGARVVGSPGSLRRVNARAETVLRQVHLEDRRSTAAADLSYGEQRQLELAVALASSPALILLDEPTAGMSPAETEQMVELLVALPRDMTVMIIEHDMDVVAAFAEHITVLHQGQVIADGPAATVRADDVVHSIYLGLTEDRDVSRAVD